MECMIFWAAPIEKNMNPIIIYHNPRCSKSREALKLLEEKQVPLVVREYLKNHLSLAEIKELHRKLGIPTKEMIRTGEEEYSSQKLEGASENELLFALSQFPILLQRPIVVAGDKALIARPAEKLNELLVITSVISENEDGTPSLTQSQDTKV